MPVPPALTATQRSEAFEKSLTLRRERALLKSAIRHGPMTIQMAWGRIACMEGMKVYSILRALPGVGEATANRLLDEAGIGRHLSVAQCGQRQAERLFSLVDQLPRR